MLGFSNLFRKIKAEVDNWWSLQQIRRLAPTHEHYPKSYIKDEIGRAQLALSVGDRRLASEIWRTVRLRFPEMSAMASSGVKLLLDLEAYDELDAMMEWGTSRYPGYAHFAIGRAAVAHRRGDLTIAISRCEMLRKRFPSAGEGYIIASACLAGLDRHTEGEALMKEATVRFPNDIEVLFEYARCATRRGQWEEALRRYAEITSLTMNVSASISSSECLRRMGRFAEAENIANDLLDKFPGNSWVIVELAQIATFKGDWRRAGELWETARRRNPFHAGNYIEGAAAARQLGNDVEADAILAEGVNRINSDLGLHLAYTASAQRLGNASVAFERWSMTYERFPDCADARQQLALAAIATQSNAQQPLQ